MVLNDAKVSGNKTMISGGAKVDYDVKDEKITE
jgi:hypothetical protein